MEVLPTPAAPIIRAWTSPVFTIAVVFLVSHHDAWRQRLAVIARGVCPLAACLRQRLGIKRHVLIDFFFISLWSPIDKAVLTVAYGL